MLENILITNKKVLDYLEQFLNKDILESTYSIPKGFDGSDYDSILEYATSNNTIVQIAKDRSKLRKYSYNKIFGETEAGTYIRETIGNLIGYDRYYTSAYVPKGFVGWHADDDIAGWYLMFTYAESDRGYFKYRDPKTESIITFNDTKGWMTRIGYLGIQENIVWHCAAAFDNRYTILFLYDTKEKFDHAVSILTTGG